LCAQDKRLIFAPADSASKGERRVEDPGELHSYRLVFTEGAAGSAIEVEFPETCADPAFNIARKICGTGEVQIFVDDRLLGRMKRSSAGYWIVS
jgi:hypothetical protein